MAVFGAEKADRGQIERFVERSLGSRLKSQIDTKKLENELRKEFEDISSVSVAIVGQSVVVNINQIEIPQEIGDDFAPLISQFDGRISQINLVQGTLAINEGDIVKKGDILVSGNQRLVNAKPFVFDRIPYWDEDGKYSNYIEEMRRHGDITDLHVSMYGVADNGNIYRDHGSSYIDLEYYDKELIGAEKFLISLSNYIKGTNSLELLLRSYDVIKNEQRIDGERN